MENEAFKPLNDFVSHHLTLPSPIHEIVWQDLHIKLFIKRDDLIHPVISGNKWRKLRGHLEHYKSGKYDGVVSMGSAYSNHLHALSYTCYQLKIPCTCLIYSQSPLFDTPTVQDCIQWQSKCIGITRAYASQLRTYPGNSLEFEGKKYLWIPEGGGGIEGEEGIHQIITELPDDFDQSDHLMLCGCGTGTTLKGLFKFSEKIVLASKRVVRNAVYDFEDHPRMIWIKKNEPYKFSKLDKELESFMHLFQKQFGIMLDRVYTGPLLWSFSKEPSLHAYRKIFFIHSGGLQGNRDH